MASTFPKKKKLGHHACMICLTSVSMATGILFGNAHTQSDSIWIQVYDVSCDHANIFCYFPKNDDTIKIHFNTASWAVVTLSTHLLQDSGWVFQLFMTLSERLAMLSGMSCHQ